MPEMQLKEAEFTYSGCGPFSKNKERIKKIKETGDFRHIYQKDLDKACSKHDIHDMTYGNFKDLARRTFDGKVIYAKTLIIAKNPKLDGCRHGIAPRIYILFDKKTSDKMY